MPSISQLIALTFALAIIAACSNNDGRSEPAEEQSSEAPPSPPPTPTPTPTRGTLLNSPEPIATVTVEELITAVGASGVARNILEFIGSPECAVDVLQLQYNTVDVGDQPTTASGALMIPSGTAPACQGPRSIVVYAHGTQAVRSYNIANISDPDNAEGLLMAAAFAAQGYIVVAPNYVGLDTSATTGHPFLHADQQAKDTVDALTATRSALPTSSAPTVTDAGKLFLTGYSQGGFVAMATHRLMQQTGAAVTASAPMSGPYALAAFGDAVFYGQVMAGAPLFVAYAVIGYQRAYGDVYSGPADFFEPRYASGIESILPTTGSRSELYDLDKLPQKQLFSSTPPDPSYAPFTPATAPPALAPVFAVGFGPDHLVTNAYRLAFLQDAQINPDGGFPTVTDGLPVENPGNGLRKAFKANDLRNWVPTSPVLLCAGSEDPTVFYMNTQLLQDYWTANGVTTDIDVLDVDSGISIDGPYATIKAGFALAKEATAASGGATAVFEAYHSTLVSPFCLSAARSFFDGYD